MRPVIYSVAASLDGFIAGPKGEYDWIPDEPTMDWDAFMSRFDTLLMGRRTWETVMAQPQEHHPAGEWVVFSDSLPRDAARLVVRRADALHTVRRLKAKEGKGIWLFGRRAGGRCGGSRGAHPPAQGSSPPSRGDDPAPGAAGGEAVSQRHRHADLRCGGLGECLTSPAVPFSPP